MTSNLTNDEISLYDRQIRLWGFEGQSKLRNARVLVMNLNGAGVEIVKNLTLGGIGHISIADSTKVLEQDLNVNFFIDKSQIGERKVDAAKVRIADMNNRTDLIVRSDDWSEWGNEVWKEFDIVVSCGMSGEEMGCIDEKCREVGVRYLACGVHGLFGYIFNDLIEIQNWIKLDKTGRDVGDRIGEVSEIVKIEDLVENDVEMQRILVKSEYKRWKDVNFTIIDKMYSSDKKKIKKVSRKLFWMLGVLELEGKYGISIEDVNISCEELVGKVNEVAVKYGMNGVFQFTIDEMELLQRNIFCEYAPTNAIIGGVVSQDVVNTLVQQELCVTNFAVFDGENLDMPVYIL